MTLTQTYESFYEPRVERFVEAIQGEDTSGMPEPHLPYWGPLYEHSALKIGIVGRDTRTWGNMGHFVQTARNDIKGALHRNRQELDGLAFTGWTRNSGRTFWDTAMKVLAAMHDVPDWKQLKRRTVTAPLQSFFWANTNSVERFEVTPSKEGVPFTTWRTIKTASEIHIDSLTTLLSVFQPNIVFLFHWQPEAAFLDCELEWELFGDHQASAYVSSTATYIIRTAHPTWLSISRRYQRVIEGVISRGKEAINGSK